MSAVGFRVREGGRADLPQVIALERAAVEAPHWAEAEYGAIVDAQDGGVRRCLFVAETEDRVVGFAVGKVIGARPGSRAEVECVAVDAAARRGGVGRALCVTIADWVREQGAETLELEVRAASAGAIALYTGLGFVVVGRRRAYYQGPADDAVLMQLELGEGK